MPLDQILSELRSLASPRNVAGMARFGIRPANPLGISVTTLRKLARSIPRDHDLAEALWATGIHEARILASIVDVPAAVTEEQMERWAAAFDSWDLCDQCCGNLFDKTPFAWKKVREWCRREEEFVRRAGFALLAWLAVHDKKTGDELFIAAFPLIREGAPDGRNFVRKAVDWALRQTGKRNLALHGKAVALAEELGRLDAKSARWIARNTLRELTGEKVRLRLEGKKGA